MLRLILRSSSVVACHVFEFPARKFGGGTEKSIADKRFRDSAGSVVAMLLLTSEVGDVSDEADDEFLAGRPLLGLEASTVSSRM